MSLCICKKILLFVHPNAVWIIMSKTSKDYFNEGYYEAMNDVMVYLQQLKTNKVMPTDTVIKIHQYSMNKRPKENYAA